MGAPKDKLIIGIPFYARTFTLRDPNNNGLHAPINRDTEGGPPGKYTNETGFLAYYEVIFKYLYLNLCSLIKIFILLIIRSAKLLKLEAGL